MSYFINGRFDFVIPMSEKAGADIIVEHRYENYDFVYFDCEVALIDDLYHVRFFTDKDHDDVIDVAKFILEIDNEVVPIRIDTIVFPYTTNKYKPGGGGLMVISLATKEYTDLDCTYVADKITSGQFRFESAFKYVKR